MYSPLFSPRNISLSKGKLRGIFRYAFKKCALRGENMSATRSKNESRPPSGRIAALEAPENTLFIIQPGI